MEAAQSLGVNQPRDDHFYARFAQPTRSARRRAAPFDATTPGTAGSERLQNYQAVWREMLARD
jgi:hypothetical protein